MVESGADHRRHPWQVLVVAWIACPVTLLVYLGLKQFSYRPVVSDENIYYYMAKVMAEGKAWPYRDFFFAHPPLQLVTAALAFKFFGSGFAVAKTLPILSAAASGLAVFAIAWRRFGPCEAVAAQAAFLFSFGLLRNSSHYTGTNLALALLLWGIYLLLRRRDVAGGILLALSVLTAVYMVPGVLMILLWRVLQEPKRGLRAALVVVGAWVVVTLGFLIFAGGAYWHDVFAFHLMKKPKPQNKRPIISRIFLFHNFYLSWATVVALGALAWRRREPSDADVRAPTTTDRKEASPKEQRRERKKAKRSRTAAADTPDATARRVGRIARFVCSRHGFVVALLLFVVLYMLWLVQLHELYDYYFMVLFPPLALLVGYVVGEIGAGFAAVVRRRGWLAAARSVLLCAVVGLGYGFVKHSQVEQFFANRGPDNPPKPQRYTWFDAPRLGPLNSLCRAVFWKDERDPYDSYFGPTYYLWHEMRHLEELGAAVEYVRLHSDPGDCIFGESGLAPLVAFLADRDLAGYVADTNTKRFSSGQTTIAALLKKVDVPELRYVIASHRRGKYRYVNRLLTPWLTANFTEVYRFTSRTNPGITWLILERI